MPDQQQLTLSERMVWALFWTIMEGIPASIAAGMALLMVFLMYRGLLTLL
jgi:hypothetical protein